MPVTCPTVRPTSAPATLTELETVTTHLGRCALEVAVHGLSSCILPLAVVKELVARLRREGLRVGRDSLAGLPPSAPQGSTHEHFVPLRKVVEQRGGELDRVHQEDLRLRLGDGHAGGEGARVVRGEVGAEGRAKDGGR